MHMPEASVHAINVSDGGVPKRACGSAWIDAEGVEGDRQRDLRYHGGPNRAVALYSLELIRTLQAEGHPIVPGSIGENLTLSGLDWGLMVPGIQVQVGDVLLELTAYAAPCKKIAGSFTGDAFTRVSQKVHPGWSRLYATVLRPGRVMIDAPVAIPPV